MPLPKPHKNESQDEFISRCMSNETVKKEFPDQKQRTAVCFSQSKKKESADWHLIEFSVPIIEKGLFNDEFIIKGTAISETVTHNGHKYVAEELSVAAPSLKGRPLLIDHNNAVESIKGKVVNAMWDPLDKSIKFEAKIMDKTIQEMVTDGRLSTVSIGAYATDLIKEEDSNAYIAKGLKFVELSLVAVPADENATFSMAFDKSYNLKEALFHSQTEIPKVESLEISNRLKGGLDHRMEENVQEKAQLLSENEQLKAELNKFKEERKAALVERYKSLCKEKKLTAKDVNKLSEEMITLLTEQVSEIKLETSVPLKGEIAPKVETTGLDGFVIEASEEGGNAIWKMPDKRKRMVLLA